jgi:ubiquinone/menaquinone biosynthesis C-methylase UbiE
MRALVTLRANLLKYKSPLYNADDYFLQQLFYPQLVIASGRKRRNEMLKCLKGGFVLEAGCGRGWLSVEIAKQVCDLVAVDLSRVRIKEAKALFETEKVDIPLIRASLTHLPLRTIMFDSIISCDVLEHIPDIGLALSEMRRVLCLDGILCLTLPNGYGSFGIIHDIVLPMFGRGEKGIESKHEHRLTVNNLNNLISKGGFTILSFFNSEVFVPIYAVVFFIFHRSRFSWQILENADVEKASRLPRWLGSVWVLVCKKTSDSKIVGGAGI